MKTANFELAKQLRHELHSHPEISNEERWTKQRLMDFLAEHTKLNIVDRGLWFYAVYKAKRTRAEADAKNQYATGIAEGALSTDIAEGATSTDKAESAAPTGAANDTGYGNDGVKRIAFRADFDAVPIEDEIEENHRSQIPGVGHKCGHDGHAAALAGLALEVDRQEASSDVYFIFQHAEETGDGAKLCAELIDECHIHEIYSFHNMSGYPEGAVVVREGTIWCASKGMEIGFEGTPAHASLPETGRNPAFAVASIVNQVSDLIAPQRYKGLVLCTVIQMDVGERAFGCAASRGKLLLTIRAQYEEELNQLQQELEGLARAEGEKYGLAVTFDFCDEFPETVNETGCVEKIRSAAAALGLPVIEIEKPMRSSEDFGYFLKRTAGAMFFLGNGEDYPPIHTAKYDFPDEQIRIAVEMFKTLLG